MAARLRRLGVPTFMVEKNERPGDSWRKRYKSPCLHAPFWYDHMPYMPYLPIPDDWPVFALGVSGCPNVPKIGGAETAA